MKNKKKKKARDERLAESKWWSWRKWKAERTKIRKEIKCEFRGTKDDVGRRQKLSIEPGDFFAFNVAA